MENRYIMLVQFVKQLYQYILKYYVRGYTDRCLQNHNMCHPPGDNVNRPSLSCSRIIFINLGESVSEGLKGTFPPKRCSTHLKRLTASSYVHAHIVGEKWST